MKFVYGFITLIFLIASADFSTSSDYVFGMMFWGCCIMIARSFGKLGELH